MQEKFAYLKNLTYLCIIKQNKPLNTHIMKKNYKDLIIEVAEETSPILDFVSDCDSAIESAETKDEVMEIFEEWKAGQEVIYYSCAWETIKRWVEERNDYNFGLIRDILCNYGYNNINDLGSEVIATLLTQYEYNEAFCDIYEELPYTLEDEEENE